MHGNSQRCRACRTRTSTHRYHLSTCRNYVRFVIGYTLIIAIAVVIVIDCFPLPLQREKMAIYERKKQLGSGVTSDAQFIFDQLSKTLSCKWHNDVIVVMDEVHIHPPYTLNDVRAEDEHKRNHIKRIVSETPLKQCEHFSLTLKHRSIHVQLEGVLQKLAKHVQ